jgi:uncharacterized protein involved in exopolysaccharide biosynthesis
MTPGRLDDYLRALEDALRGRGLEPSRIVDEAREHLVDAIEEGLRRGLAQEDAERDALDRFGPPHLLAAQAPTPRSYAMARMTNALDAVIGNWRWMTGATALAAIVAGGAAYYWLPAQYRSESVIAVSGDPAHARLRSVAEVTLSDPYLERLVKEFGLGDGTSQMRRRISVEVTRAEPSQLKLAFSSPDPRQAQRVNERLASQFIVQNLELAEKQQPATAVFKILQPPSLPDEAERPGMAKVTVSGAFAGLALSLVALAWRKD